MESPEQHPGGERDRDVERLRGLVQHFVRSFGLLVTKQTPCGQPVSPSYAHALMVLLKPPGGAGRISQAELGAALGIDKSNVARLCSRMVSAQHATQDVAPADGRSRLVALTPKGTRLAQRIDQASRDRFARIVASLSLSKRAAIFDSLSALNAAVETLREGEAQS